ncbi:MAG: hypothetical protein KDE55_23950 [Novosphingobium sp.]|nr:hypothetical protein [Novosphingobium sp.]
MATTTFGSISGATAQAKSDAGKRPFLARFFERLISAREAEARKQIMRFDPFYARFLNAPDHVREAWINSGRWHEQG